MSAYYNENDSYAAQWLRNLIAAGHIALGEVDERSILDVRADDLRGFRQCHFFSGIGVWSYALWLAGWPDEREVWTGSCPCQPFSIAGRAGGFDDGRHLWPHWSRLIGECRPVTVFGEQVASADGLAWLDFVCADLEAAGYAVGAVDTCAAGFGAPHIRQRLYFVADALRNGTEHAPGQGMGAQAAIDEGNRRISRERLRSGVESATRSLADAKLPERRAHVERRADDQHEVKARTQGAGRAGERCESGDVGDAEQPGLQEQRSERGIPRGKDEAEPREAVERTGAPTNGFWRDAEWLPCIDGKARPVEPSTFPLAHGAPARVGRLRAYGNAITAPQAAEFIRAYMA